MIIDLHESDFPSIYTQLTARFPKKPWIRCTQDLQRKINANPILEAVLKDENRITYGLTWFDEGVGQQDLQAWEFVKVAMAFAIQVIALCDAEALEESRSLAGRVAGAFSHPEDMRAMILELHTAIGLHRRGFTVNWPEATSGSSETFDILADGESPSAFEVECKSFSAEKGLKITQLDAANFFNTLIRMLSPTLQRGEVVAASITIPDRLPTRTEELRNLCELVYAAIINGDSDFEGMFEIEKIPVDAFEPEEGKNNRRIANQFLEHIRGLMEKKSDATRLVVTTPQHAGIFLTVESEIKRRSMKRWEDTAKDAVRKQMTGNRPGCLVIRLENMSSSKMTEICAVHPNFLSAFASNLLSNNRHAHLACIVFVSNSEWVKSGDISQLGQSCTYVFDNPGGNYPNFGLGSHFLE